MTADLVSRLLSAIQEREDHHAGVARALEVLDGTEGAVGSPGYIRPATAERLRMCGVHRRIVETYQGALFTQECHPEYEANNGYVQALAEVLGWLAEGYGIEEPT